MCVCVCVCFNLSVHMSVQVLTTQKLTSCQYSLRNWNGIQIERERERKRKRKRKRKRERERERERMEVTESGELDVTTFLIYPQTLLILLSFSLTSYPQTLLCLSPLTHPLNAPLFSRL